MKEPGLILNFDDVEIRRKVWTNIRTLRGLWELDLKRIRPTRSLKQNRYYFGCFVVPWRDWLRENYGDPTITTEQAHDELKLAILGPKKIKNQTTGATLELIPETHDKDTEEFNVYMEKAREFLARVAEITVLEPELFVTGE